MPVLSIVKEHESYTIAYCIISSDFVAVVLGNSLVMS